MPVRELADFTGHWIWEHDVGTQSLLDEAAGPAVPFYQQPFASEVEHWFHIREDDTWAMRVVGPSTEPSGEVQVLDFGGAARKTRVLHEGEEIVSTASTYIAEDKLVIEWRGTTREGRDLHWRNSKEVISGKYYSTVEDLARDVRATRIFRRYPWYRIVNNTGVAVTLKTYLPSDVACLVPAMATELRAGESYIDASSSCTEREKAFFSMADGRQLACNLYAAETVTLDADDFNDLPYYRIENRAGVDVSIALFWSSDFVYLIPTQTVVVKPGTSFVMATSSNVCEEQAVFTLHDGRRSDPVAVRAFETFVVDPAGAA